MRRFLYLGIFSAMLVSVVFSSERAGREMVCFEQKKGAFPVFENGRTPPVVISREDHPGLSRIASLFTEDVEKVTGVRPTILFDTLPPTPHILLVGTLGKNPYIQRLVQTKKLDVRPIAGKWEATLMQVIKNPFPGIQKALVIVGSDKRGTFYGLFGLSRAMGVSPWVWWADVPVQKREKVYVLPGPSIEPGPKVKYRGIFLNDEEPCLGRWAVANYGGFTHGFYEKVFELLLRLRGNFLWPAMWWASFNSDDPENPRLAHEMGIVMGTSHHEPMMRAHAEWRKTGEGPWDYEKNSEVLREFWREGIRRMGDHESIVTIGMRGDGDLAMSDSTNIALLERIVRDQREILRQVTGRDPETIPQAWALYKEVQDYFDKGMRVPDDVTLLLCDDNWGNVRWLPRPNTPPRKGGYGMYYHFDFVGGPRNYKWLNTNPLSRIWEQMHLTYRHGVDRIWIVNVGDLKPMELPISFFLDYAWDPDALSSDRLFDYTRRWAAEQFGGIFSDEIAEILIEYPRLNGRRKPELLDPDTYSLIHDREWERAVAEYDRLLDLAESIRPRLPDAYHDAYYQLVLHPVQACANLHHLYWTVAKNRLYSRQGRVMTNDLAEEAERLFKKDAEISFYYNHILSNGKWKHMMDQPHIGYTSWQQPDRDIMPEVKRIDIPVPPKMGVAIEGSERVWPDDPTEAVLPECDAYRRPMRYVEIFNRGKRPFSVSIHAGADWLHPSMTEGEIEKEVRVWIAVDWPRVPYGRHRIPIRVKGSEGSEATFWMDIHHPTHPRPEEVLGFVESEGIVSIEAEHFTRKVETQGIRWLVIPHFGRTLSGVTSMPVTAPSQLPGSRSPRLAYRMYLFSSGKVRVHAYFSPIQNYLRTQGFRYAVSFDQEVPQLVNVHLADTIPDWKYPLYWNRMVADQIKIHTTEHMIEKPGWHTLFYWRVDPGLVLQKLVVDCGGMKPVYLGPQESFFRMGEKPRQKRF